jgi:hypothetical protein
MKAAMTLLLISAVLLAAATVFRPNWLAPGSRPEPTVARPWVEFTVAPDPRIALLARRKVDKEEVVQRLFDGELTVLEAAERFRRLNASPPGLEDFTSKVHPGGDEGERLCNQAITWTRAVMVHARPQAEVEARVAVLRRELQDHVATHGGVELAAAGAE